MAESVKQEVLAVCDVWRERYNEADFHGMMECFTEDCVFLPPDSDPVVGKKDCMLVSTGYHSSGGQHTTYPEGGRGLRFEMLGEDSADAVNFIDIRNQEGHIFSHVKSWVLFKKVNGKWLVHRHAYSPRTKPAQPKSDK